MENSTRSDEWLLFFGAGLDIVPEIIRSPERLDLLRAYFEARIDFWPYPYATSEWNPGNFDSLTLELETHVAFQLISTATALLLEQTGPQRIADAGWMLMDIVTRSDTTELPPFLDENWPAVMSLLKSVMNDEEHGFSAQAANDALARWYRRHRPAA
jgi:hypothetical protein